MFTFLSVCLSVSVEMEHGSLVKTAASLFRNFCYKDRDSSIAGIICAGWDHMEGGQVRAKAHKSGTNGSESLCRDMVQKQDGGSNGCISNDNSATSECYTL